ncbi:hypothetical protein AC579_6689 [Pseudocercospora musae]|uniref:Uncharacterized protein n=1 Tax=Pseudocercospora musae TaxID=113226 RepID=A0A139HSX3_9PEZI|nr:hypothetical protein AC579_6689 [Pseudocercospora musae]
MATGQEIESPAEQAETINSYIPEKMLAIQELDELFLPPILMLKFSTGVFLFGSFTILAGIMSGPLWMMWQKNEVNHIPEKAKTQNIDDPDQKDKIDSRYRESRTQGLPILSSHCETCSD